MIIVVLWIAAMLVHYVVGAMVAAVLWSWFIVPLGVPAIKWVMAAGIMLTIRVLTGPRFPPNPNMNASQVAGQVIGIFLFYCIALLIGLLLKVG